MICHAQHQGGGVMKLSVKMCETLVALKLLLAFCKMLEGIAVVWASMQKACMDGTGHNFVVVHME